MESEPAASPDLDAGTFRRALESGPVGFALVDSSARCLIANRALGELLGESHSGFGGVELTRFVAPEHAELVALRIASVAADIEAPPWSGEVRFVRADCRPRWAMTVISHVPPTQAPRVLLQLVDITAWKLAHLAIADTQRLSDRIVCDVPMGLVATDLTGHVTLANPAACRLLGSDRTALLGKRAHEAFHHSFEDGTPYPSDRCPIEASTTVGTTSYVETEVFFRADGGAIPVSYASAPMMDRDRVVGSVIAFTDISDRVNAFERGRESGVSYRHPLESFEIGTSSLDVGENTRETLRTELAARAPIGIATFDTDDRCTFANPRWLELIGLELTRVLGVHRAAFIHPDDADRLAEIDRRAALGETGFTRLRVARSDGTSRNVVFRSAVLDGPEGTALGRVCTIDDVDELHIDTESDSEIRLFVESSRDLLSRHAPEGTFLYASPNSAQLLGYEPSELIGRSLFDFVHPSDIPERAAVESGARMLADVLPSLFRRRHADGHYVWFEGTAWLAWEGASEGFETILVSRDATKRREAEDALARSEEQLRQLQKMEAVGRLAGGIAHDFNNLLTAIVGYTSLLAARVEGDRVRDFIDGIRQATSRATELNKQLLTFSRKQVLEPRVLDLDALVTDVAKMVRLLVGERIELVIARTPDLGRVRADPGSLHQCIMNLSVNARDAMPGGGVLTIATTNVAMDPSFASSNGVAPGEYVALSVADTGTGMTDEVKAHLFEPFFTTKEVGKGTGFGLSTVYGIVKQSGGAVSVESTLARGTKITIFLPSVLAHASTTTEVSPSPSQRGGAETVLVVEDDDLVRNIARIVLEDLGYRVLDTSRSSAARSLADAYSGKIDLLLLDVVLPGDSGPELAAGIKLSRPDVRLLFMSGHLQTSMAGDAFPGSEHAVLAKPFSPSELARAVREVLDKGVTAPRREPA